MQIRLLHRQLTTRSTAYAASFLLPLALPICTAIDLVAGQRQSPLAFRLPLAILTLLVPLFMLLELQRLQAGPQPVASRSAEWPEWMSLCPTSRACGAPDG